MKKNYRFLFFMMTLLLLNSVEAKVITGKVFYAIDHSPIEGARIYARYSSDTAVTDRNGWFEIQIDSSYSEVLGIYADHCEYGSIDVKNRWHVEQTLKLSKIEMECMFVRAEVSLRPGTRDEIFKIIKHSRRNLIPWQEEIFEQIEYPQILLEMGIQGKVYYEFDLLPNGEIQNIALKKGIFRELDLRILQLITQSRSMTEEEYAGLGLKEKSYTKNCVLCVRFMLTHE
jgi:hypothetical protein